MKPQTIYLVRHAQSQGNVNKKIYTEIPDYAVPLTDKGKFDAHARGVDLKRKIGNGTVMFYVSPFRRTRQTFEEISKSFQPEQIIFREDPRLREQEWCGKFQIEGYDDTQERERHRYGSFYYRFQGGENCADVYDRVGGFLDTLHRDFEKPNFPRHCVVVSHGMALRVLVMRWFHMTVEEFEVLKNPLNCQTIVLNKTPNDKYELVTPLEKWDKPTHPYQFPLTIENERKPNPV